MAIQAGLARGLAQDLQYDQRIQDLRYQKQEMDRAQALNAAKVKMFVDDTDYMNAVNQFDNPRIKQYSEQVIKDLGKYINENPDYMYDSQKMMEVKRMKRQLKDNPYLHQGMASDDAIKKLHADMAEVAKNPEMHDKGAYERLAQQEQNYYKFGNQDGEDAARQIGAKAFVYNKPRDFRDLNEDFVDIGNKFKDVKQTAMAGKGRNAFSEYANPETLKIIANQYYSQNPEQINQEAAKAGMNPIEYVMKGIDAHIPKRVDYGDYGLIDAMTLRNMDRRAAKKDGAEVPQGPTTWDYEIRGKMEGTDSGEVFDKAIGIPKDVKIADNDGNQIDLTGIEFQHTGRHKVFEETVIGNDGKPKKVKVKKVEVFADIPKEVSDKYGFTYDPWGWGDYKINSNFENNSQVMLVDRSDKEGKSFKATQIKTWRPLDVDNQASRGRYDKINMATKYQEGVDQGSSNEVEQRGYIYDRTTGKALRKAQ
jgi:hypothetical protein